KPRVVKVSDRVFCAVDYALANMIMVETADSVVIIDTTESLTVAQTVMAEFRKISPKPVKAVIYTHNHADHFRGTKACFQEGLKVIAHEDFMKEVKLQQSRGRSAIVRGIAMFGLSFPVQERFPWPGTSPEVTASHLMWEDVKKEDLIFPNQTFKDKYSFHEGGLTFNLIHAPGETPDQLIVHVPELKFVCCADNYYPCFPNLYTIRGTSNRPVMDWADSQDKAMALAPEFLVPCHGSHIEGKSKIREVLGNYRDAIKYVYNYTLEAVAQYKPVHEAAAQVALPPKLADLPYLKQYYGCLPYCVRSIYDSIVGWFDGDPVNLSPLSKKELGHEILQLAGSAEKVLAQAEKAQKAGRHQATLELCEMVLTNDPDNKAAHQMKAVSFFALSQNTINMPTVNYYRTAAAMEKKKG
ncbi:MAG: alkyl/aryl-sulfatase, partial [Thermodesulfobacteriota bacterium]